MEMTEQRIELRRLNLDLGKEMKRYQKESLTMRITDEAISVVNDRIVANERIDEETIKALFNFLSQLQKAHKLHVSEAMEDMIDID